MIRILALAFTALAASGLAMPVQAHSAPAQGTLIIVGGALESDNAAVFTALLNARAPGASSVAIIPAASGNPATSAQTFAEDLGRYGLQADDAAIVRLAIMDDPDTAGVDESRWSGNANSASEIAKIKQAGAIWFTGGDQVRIVQTLLDADGSDTPMMAAIRERLAQGAVVGGTSAGAAIMSALMILQGDSPGALLGTDAGEPLAVGHGLGFLPNVLVDQHFGERARLGRLALALGMVPQPSRIGLGIDENTGLIVNLGAGRADVVGAGYVTMLDARSARYEIGSRIGIADMQLAIASAGDTITLAQNVIAPADYKRTTLGREYIDQAATSGGGIAIPGTTLPELLGEQLVDNKSTEVLERISFAGEAGVAYRFVQDGDSQGWWGRAPDGTGRYTVTGVGFEIEPVRVTVER